MTLRHHEQDSSGRVHQEQEQTGTLLRFSESSKVELEYYEILHVNNADSLDERDTFRRCKLCDRHEKKNNNLMAGAGCLLESSLTAVHAGSRQGSSVEWERKAARGSCPTALCPP